MGCRLMERLNRLESQAIAYVEVYVWSSVRILGIESVEKMTLCFTFFSRESGDLFVGDAGRG